MGAKETGGNATKPDPTSPQATTTTTTTTQSNDKKDQKNDNEEELTEEDAKLKEDLEMLVQRLTESDSSLYAHSLEQLKESISSSTTSMTAVPKPLKFLHPHYPELAKAFESWTDPNLKSKFADVLSVLSMTHSDEGKYDALKFRLFSQEDDYTKWGHEYIRHLALEIGEVSADLIEEEGETAEVEETTPKFDEAKIKKVVLKIVPFFLKHNQEADAIDLLLETDNISELPQFVDKEIFKRVGLYLVSCVPLLPPPDDLAFLQTAYTIYLEHGELTQALALAIRIDSVELIEAVFNATDDLSIKKQLALILSKQNFAFKLDEVQDLIDNRRLSEKFRYLAKELNLLDPKVPEDVYKSHLENSRSETSNIDSAKQNLAASFVNSFLNLGYGTDKLLTTDDKWIYKTKGDGMLSTTASIGSINQWDTESIQELDKYLYSNDEEIKAGALLGMGLTGSGAHDEVDSVLLILQDYVTNSNKKLAMSSILGLALAFSGSQNQDLLELLLPLVSNLEVPVEVSALSALALGHAFVGTCNGDITDTILQTLLERSFEQLESKWTKFLALGLGLLYMGKADQVDDVLETIAAVEHPISKSLEVLTRISAYAGTGNVLEIQGLFDILTPKGPPTEKKEGEDEEEEDKEEGEDEKTKKKDADGDEEIVDADVNAESTGVKKDGDATAGEDEDDEEKSEEKVDDSLAYAVLGLAVIALGEDIGKAMSLRHYGHLLDYGSDTIRRAVPLGIGLLSTSNPQVNIIESLSRMSHDQDTDVAINAIFSMGLIGTGTNNARLGQLFRQLASYHSDANALFTTRISQGLTHLGKGTLTLNPFNTENRVLSKVTLASLLTVAVGFLEPKFIMEHHYLLFFLNAAARPRVLITVDEDLNELPVTVRVGKAVDVVGQAGNPKTITGWVTQTTPVLLGYGEKAELEENSEYIAMSSFLDGIVILKKNPDYVEDEK